MKSKEDAKPGDRVTITKAVGDGPIVCRAGGVGTEYRLLRRLGCGCWTGEIPEPKDSRFVGLEITIGPSATCLHQPGSLGGYPVGTELDWEFVEATPSV